MRETLSRLRGLLTRKYFRFPVWLILLLTATAAALTPILTQTFSATPAGTAAIVTSNCSGSTALMATASPTVISLPGTVLYTCGAPTGLTSNAFAAIAGSATPTFVLPTGAGTVALSYVSHTATTTCTTGTVALTSATAVTFAAAGVFDYCLSYTSYPSAGIATFTITWSQ